MGEAVPSAMAEGLFVPIFKNKGSADDFSKYRFICLLNHALKLLSSYMLLRAVRETEKYLPASQAGFRKKRSTADQLYVLARLISHCAAAGEALVITFIDFVAAFDSVSHKFLDESLAAAGGSDKLRAVFRAFYDAAGATVRVGGLRSRVFQVDRGVVQGDIFSPWGFILALQSIMCVPTQSGISVLGLWLDRLEYADDAALLARSVEEAQQRLAELASTATRRADMEISKPKTEVMFVDSGPVGRCGGEVAAEAYEATKWSHVCECGRGFECRDSLRKHKGQHCPLQDTESYPIEKVVDVRGSADHRFYLVRWSGYAAKHDSWRHWRECVDCMDAVDEFWDASVLGRSLDRGASRWVVGETRCSQCCQLFKREQDLKTHHTALKCRWRERSRVGSRAEQCVRRAQRARVVAGQGEVALEGYILPTSYMFKYLGFWLSADGDTGLGVERRMEAAADAFRTLGRVWWASEISLGLKLRVYGAAVQTILMYSSECWVLDESLEKKLGAWNARRLAVLTGRSIRDEYKYPTWDLVGRIRSRRLKWLGKVLRNEDSSSIVRSFILAEADIYCLGKGGSSIFQDVTPFGSSKELVMMAEDSKGWKELVDKVMGHV